jgi:Exopolysaccharide synthesis, ExoD
VQRAVPVSRYLEKMIRPRWPTPLDATKRIVGIVIVMLSMTLFQPIPLSNVMPALVIEFISLAYIEGDGLVLLIAEKPADLSLAEAGSHPFLSICPLPTATAAPKHAWMKERRATASTSGGPVHHLKQPRVRVDLSPSDAWRHAPAFRLDHAAQDMAVLGHWQRDPIDPDLPLARLRGILAEDRQSPRRVSTMLAVPDEAILLAADRWSECQDLQRLRCPVLEGRIGHFR